MSLPRQQERDWDRFSLLVRDHVTRTYQGHYVKEGAIEPLAFFESRLDSDFLAGTVSKYALRVKITRNPTDLLKAAQYLGQLYKKITRENESRSSKGEKEVKSP